VVARQRIVRASATSRYLAPLIEWFWPTGSAAQRFALLMAIRKFAHPSVYAVLAGLAFRAALLSGVSGLARGAAVALAMAVSIAGLDELRQTQTRTRTGRRVRRRARRRGRLGRARRARALAPPLAARASDAVVG
jgi:hypothetical protein